MEIVVYHSIILFVCLFCTIIAAGQEVTSDELDEVLDEDKGTRAFTASVSFTNDSSAVEWFNVTYSGKLLLVQIFVINGKPF